MFLSIGMLKLNYFLADIFILSAEKQPIKLSWRKIECLRMGRFNRTHNVTNKSYPMIFQGVRLKLLPQRM